MLRRNYGSVKGELARLAGSTGMNTSDVRLLAYVNAAIEELMNEGDWPTIIDRLKFKISTPKITLPSDYDRMLYCTVNDVPQQMQSPWFEFVGYGLDLLSAIGAVAPNPLLPRYEGVLDKDAVATFEDVPITGGPFYPRVLGVVDERVAGVRPVINIQGYDASGKWIRSPDGTGGYKDGVDVAINGDADPFYITSSQSISYVTAITKPVTKGYVLLYAVNSDASVQQYLGQYAPNDTTPFYRRYSIPNLCNNAAPNPVCVLARLRRRFVPITTDADFLLISNLPALKAMMQAVYYMEAKDPDNYAKYKLTAIDLLRKEAKAYIGLQRQKPFMTVSESQGVRTDGILIL
jgi:hypothetical protein